MSPVLDRMRVVNVGAARVMMNVTASTSLFDHIEAEIFSVLNDKNSEPGSGLDPIFRNLTSTRVSDSSW